MTRFLATHPLLAAALLCLVLPVMNVPASILLWQRDPSATLSSGAYEDGIEDSILPYFVEPAEVTACFWPGLCCAAIVLLRRRSGLALGRKMWLTPLLLAIGAQALGYMASVVFMGYELEKAGQGAMALWIKVYLGQYEYYIGEFRMVAIYAAVSALPGILIGQAIGNWYIRTGRWETIVPVTRPKGA